MSGDVFCKKLPVGENIAPGNFKTGWPQKDSQTGIHLHSDSRMRQHLK